MSSVDFRCPNSPRRLFARLEVPPDVVATEGFELSVACLDCRRAAREHNYVAAVRKTHSPAGTAPRRRRAAG
jgi:hypothetical protein